MGGPSSHISGQQQLRLALAERDLELNFLLVTRNPQLQQVTATVG